jgi:AcrR family transcriptional regulator
VLNVGATRPERADAARNRDKVLSAARTLFDERSIADVSMEDIARAAKVGRGTLYRRYPDKGSIAYALLDRDERDLQSRILTGVSPLGPGAATAEDRLSAFIGAYVHFAKDAMALLLAAEATPHARMQTGAYRFWRLHCTVLLTECDVQAPQLLAEVLLSCLTAEQIGSWLEDPSVGPSRLPELLMETVIKPHLR